MWKVSHGLATHEASKKDEPGDGRQVFWELTALEESALTGRVNSKAWVWSAEA